MGQLKNTKFDLNENSSTIMMISGILLIVTRFAYLGWTRSGDVIQNALQFVRFRDVCRLFNCMRNCARSDCVKCVFL